MDVRQVPARVRRISEIDISRDARVRVVGKISSKEKDSFFISDDTGKIQVLSAPEIVSRLYDGQTVRVYAQVVPGDEGLALRAELVHDATGMDVNLYKLTEKMWIEAGPE